MQPHIAPIVKFKMALETSTSGKNNGKIHKRIHKSEREKMKRENLNELFLALANSLEVSDQNNGKASMLVAATRTVKDMLDQIERLRKENATLLSESKYVNVETSELKDENTALEAEIGKLRTEIESKTKLQLDLNIAPPECHNQDQANHNHDSPLVFPVVQHGPRGQIVSPSHFTTLCSNIQDPPEVGIEQLATKHVSLVSKPHARYLTPADRWPSQVLDKQTELGRAVPRSYRNTK
ncbi:transcription factor bHLH47-like isoform X2 [Salvia hispanica]|uniref:transcription factor bHLH47-like isoform X2 n=1 Tax=Salvia hispanica TaxID=49212 RepID=UPI00200991F8|nr:transcription factor bHLH47-like isoform X2 [Salvia hispanica]XP_047966524.1 transcription factor bHLH47-like isoform X2 [Salvia hispanica]